MKKTICVTQNVKNYRSFHNHKRHENGENYLTKSNRNSQYNEESNGQAKVKTASDEVNLISTAKAINYYLLIYQKWYPLLNFKKMIAPNDYLEVKE